MDESLTFSQQATQPSMSPQPTGEVVGDGDESVLFNDEYWGRLYPAQPNVRAHDLIKDETIIGKQKSCDVSLKVDEVSNLIWVVVSRKHFSITRTQVERFGKCHTEIRLNDLSMNGTFINGSHVGKGKSKILTDNSVISMGKAENTVFYFKDASVINKRHPPVIVKKYDACVRLGTGAYGEVTLMFSKETCKGYAMKTILKSNHTSKKKQEAELVRLENEVKILKRIKHPNVIQLIDSITYQSQKYLFLELMLGKDLFTRITLCKRLTESQAKLYFYQIASGVQYLHQNEIIHRDLKPENVLLATDDDETIVKITDFGLSKVLHSNTNLRSLCGTKLYVAPEVLESGGSRIYTGQVDVWSMGVILYVCLSGNTPFSSDRNGKTMDEQIKSGHYVMSRAAWEGVSTAAKEIVREMMTLDAEKRISLSQIFEHPWLQDSALKATVERLLPKREPSPEKQLKQLMMPCEGKENKPSLQENKPSSQEKDLAWDEISSSPVSAAVVLMSPPLSPPRKRRRLR